MKAHATSTTLGRSGSEVMVEALPAVRAAQEDAGEHGQDAPPDGGQARPGRWAAVAAVGSFFPRVAGAAGRRRRAGTGARGGAGRASSDPRSGPAPTLP